MNIEKIKKLLASPLQDDIILGINLLAQDKGPEEFYKIYSKLVLNGALHKYIYPVIYINDFCIFHIRRKEVSKSEKSENLEYKYFLNSPYKKTLRPPWYDLID